MKTFVVVAAAIVLGAAAVWRGGDEPYLIVDAGTKTETTIQWEQRGFVVVLAYPDDGDFQFVATYQITPVDEWDMIFVGIMERLTMAERT